jgi:fructose-1,6-bisphosphatase
VLIHLISQTHFNITIIKYKKEQAKLKRRGEEIKETRRVLGMFRISRKSARDELNGRLKERIKKNIFETVKTNE